MPVFGANKEIQTALQACSGVTAQPHRFGGTEYRFGRREIGHVHADHLVDIPFPKTIRDTFVAAGRAEPHHILPDSGWVSIYLNQSSDVERAIELLRYSLEIAAKKSLHKSLRWSLEFPTVTSRERDQWSPNMGRRRAHARAIQRRPEDGSGELAKSRSTFTTLGG